MTGFMHPLVRQLRADYGEPFLRYILNIPEEADFLTELGTVDPQILHLLVMIRAQSPGDDGADFRSFGAPAAFTKVDTETQTTLTERLRQERGGQTEAPPSSDDVVVQGISEIANDVWPALLFLEADGPTSPFGTSAGLSSVSTHPALERACAAFVADEALAKLFPSNTAADASEDRVFSIRAEWILSNGQGGTRQLPLVLANVIAASGLNSLISDGKIRRSAVFDGIQANVDTLRLLATGESVPMRLFIGFAGVTATTSAMHLTERGKLRAPSEAEKRVLGATQLNAILETWVPLKILSITDSSRTIGDSADLDPFSAAWEEHAAELRENGKRIQSEVDRARLAVLLASTGEQILGMIEVARLTIDPTSSTLSPMWLRQAEPRPETELSAENAALAEQFYGSLTNLHPKSLDISRKRILSAASERADPTDAFIDAVVVWENTFGASPETSFRVTAAIAKLLEPTDTSSRAALHKELKALYNSRSKLLHGTVEADESKIVAMRQRAIEVALQILRLLYTDRSDLLALKSDERGTRVLLDI